MITAKTAREIATSNASNSKIENTDFYEIYSPIIDSTIRDAADKGSTIAIVPIGKLDYDCLSGPEEVKFLQFMNELGYQCYFKPSTPTHMVLEILF